MVWWVRREESLFQEYHYLGIPCSHEYPRDGVFWLRGATIADHAIETVSKSSINNKTILAQDHQTTESSPTKVLTFLVFEARVGGLDPKRLGLRKPTHHPVHLLPVNERFIEELFREVVKFHPEETVSKAER